MNALLASQNPAVKFFAVFSTIVISLLAVIAGAALLGMQQLTAYYDMALPRIFEHASSLGLTAVIVAWVVHLLPLYLAGALGLKTAWIGLIEGMAKAVASLVKIDSVKIPSL